MLVQGMLTSAPPSDTHFAQHPAGAGDAAALELQRDRGPAGPGGRPGGGQRQRHAALGHVLHPGTQPQQVGAACSAPDSTVNLGKIHQVGLHSALPILHGKWLDHMTCLSCPQAPSHLKTKHCFHHANPRHKALLPPASSSPRDLPCNPDIYLGTDGARSTSSSRWTVLART